MSLDLLQENVIKISSTLVGAFAVCIRDLNSGTEIGVLLDEPLPMASVCKVPILVAAYRASEHGTLDLAERVEITEKSRTFGSGLFNAFDVGLAPTIHDLLLMMIVVSDNAATDLVLERLTPSGVTGVMRGLGLPNIDLQRTIGELIGDYFIALDPGLKGIKPGEWDAFCERIPGLKERGKDLNINREAVNAAASVRDTSTARDMANLCAQIAENRCASPESCAAILDIMGKQVLNGRLPRRLPQFTRFPHKTGTLGSGAVVNDVGILFLEEEPVCTIAVLSRNIHNPIEQTETVIADIGREVYDYYISTMSAGAGPK